jgi:hypothetical protein
MFQPGPCQVTSTRLISVDTNNEELLIARQQFHNNGYIDGNIDRGINKYPGNAGESAML